MSGGVTHVENTIYKTAPAAASRKLLATLPILDTRRTPYVASEWHYRFYNSEIAI